MVTIGSIGEKLDDLLTMPSCSDGAKDFRGAVLASPLLPSELRQFTWSHTKASVRYRRIDKIFSCLRHRPFSLALDHEQGMELFRYRRYLPSLFSKPIIGKECGPYVSIERVVLSARDGSIKCRDSTRYVFQKRNGLFCRMSDLFAKRVTIPAEDPINFFPLAQAVELFWTVEIGHPGLFTVSLFTDATGVQSFLRDRDCSGTRRSAIVHWVERHWRKLRSDPSVERSVRAHFRGKWECSWRDLHLSVNPPLALKEADDQERAFPSISRVAP